LAGATLLAIGLRLPRASTVSVARLVLSISIDIEIGQL
jgi:hypothetical protein